MTEGPERDKWTEAICDNGKIPCDFPTAEGHCSNPTPGIVGTHPRCTDHLKIAVRANRI